MKLNVVSFDDKGKKICLKARSFNRSILEEGPDEPEIIVGVWNEYKCWKCHEKTRVIELNWTTGQIEMWSENDRIGLKLQQLFPSFKKDYTKTADAYYYCNHCTNCGAIQGDWFVVNWVAREGAEDHLPSDVVRLKIDPGPLIR